MQITMCQYNTLIYSVIWDSEWSRQMKLRKLNAKNLGFRVER